MSENLQSPTKSTATTAKLNRKDFAIQFTLYNITVLTAWFFFIAYANAISPFELFTNFNYFMGNTFGFFIAKLAFLWWFPLTWYFSIPITTKRLNDIGYSKWFTIFNLFPLLIAVILLSDIISGRGLENISITFIIFALLALAKIILVFILYIKPSKN